MYRRPSQEWVGFEYQDCLDVCQVRSFCDVINAAEEKKKQQREAIEKQKAERKEKAEAKKKEKEAAAAMKALKRNAKGRGKKRIMKKKSLNLQVMMKMISKLNMKIHQSMKAKMITWIAVVPNVTHVSPERQ